MAYDTKQLRLLTDRLVADGMNEWTYDDTVAPSVVAAAGYISDAMKQALQTSTGAGRSMQIGDRVVYRQWTDLTAKTAANFVGLSTFVCTALSASGATLGASGTTKNVVEDALAVTLTAAQSGATLVLDKVNGVTVTLPVPQIGLEFNFAVDVASTSVGQKIITDAASTFIKGSLPFNTTTAADAPGADAADGTTHRSLTFNGGTQGGLAGTWLKLICRTLTQWEIVAGFNLSLTSHATPVATS